NRMPRGLLLIAALLLLASRPVLRRRPVDRMTQRHHLRIAGVLLAGVMIGITPLIDHGVRLWRAGDYTAPVPSWRSGPGGVDLLTIGLGNPAHPLTGTFTRRAYERFGIDRVEGVAWIGIVPLALAAWVALKRRQDRETGLWLAVAAFFFIWALGPWLRIGG